MKKLKTDRLRNNEVLNLMSRQGIYSNSIFSYIILFFSLNNTLLSSCCVLAVVKVTIMQFKLPTMPNFRAKRLVDRHF